MTLKSRTKMCNTNNDFVHSIPADIVQNLRYFNALNNRIGFVLYSFYCKSNTNSFLGH